MQHYAVADWSQPLANAASTVLYQT